MIDHLMEYDPCLIIEVGPWQYLTIGQGMSCSTISFDIGHSNRFDAPGVIDQNFPVNTKSLIEELLIKSAPSGDISHGFHTGFHEPS